MRKPWLDYTRVFACVLVCLGHLLMSFMEAGLLAEEGAAAFFIRLIYRFHVYLFFFCGGYLLQQHSHLQPRQELVYRLHRCVDFLVPYVVFTAITYLVKRMLSGDVNSQVEGSFFHVLLTDPVNQMWYLYAAVVITAVVPLIRSDRMLMILCVACVVLKALPYIPGYRVFLPLDYLCRHMIWYVLGMCWSFKKVKLPPWLTALIGAVFLAGSLVSQFVWSHSVLDSLLTVAGIIFVVETIRLLTAGVRQTRGLWQVLSRNMLQIYLLHTICAAGIRILLLKLGIESLWLHLPIGLLFSFALPIACAELARLAVLPEIVFYPTATLRRLRKDS